MFHWICPECGREIAPTVRECPVCDGGAEQAELVLAGVVEASARTLQTNAPASLAPIDGKGIRSENGPEREPISAAADALPGAVKWTRSTGQSPGGQNTVPTSTDAEQTVADPAATAPDKAAPVQESRRSDEPLVPEILSAKAALDRAANVKASLRGMLNRAAEAWANPPIQGEGKAIATRTIESRAVETKPVETKLVETKSVETKLVETKLVETKAIVATPVETRPVETALMEGRPVVEVKSEPTLAEAKLVETTAVAASTIDLQPVQSKPVPGPVEAVYKAVEPPAEPGEPHGGDGANGNASTSEHPRSAKSSLIDVQPPVADSVKAESSIDGGTKADASTKADDSIQRTEEKSEPVEPAAAIQSAATPQFDRVPLLAKLTRLALPRIAVSTAKTELAQVDRGTADLVTSDTGGETALASPPETPAGVEPPLAANAEAQLEVPGSPASTQSGPAARAELTPEAAQREPVLPTFAPPARESLNALLADTGMLDHEAADDGAAELGGEDEVYPPTAGRLPLPAIASAPLPFVPPTVVSIGAVSPRATPTLAPQAQILVAPGTAPDGALTDATRETVRDTAREPRIAGLPLVESRFPLARPSAQALKSAAAPQPAPLASRSGAVRSPRSAAPFLAPNAAGLVKYSPLENRPIRPVPPPVDLRRPDMAPRITLPGPMLTRALVSFKDRELAPIFLEARLFRKRFAYGWLAIVLAVGTVLGVGFSNMVSTPGRPPVEARAASEATSGGEATVTDTKAAETAPVITAPAHAAGSNPLSKVIEITGFRIVMDPSRKSQVEYLVVNHSSARFPDATIYVTLRAADARVGQAPLCRFSFAAPDLGPFEAKEMISAIEKTNRTASLPEWQDLRAEIEIGK